MPHPTPHRPVTNDNACPIPPPIGQLSCYRNTLLRDYVVRALTADGGERFAMRKRTVEAFGWPKCLDMHADMRSMMGSMMGRLHTLGAEMGMDLDGGGGSAGSADLGDGDFRNRAKVGGKKKRSGKLATTGPSVRVGVRNPPAGRRQV